MIDPVDTEHEPREDVAEARIFPNPVVPMGMGMGSTSSNTGIIPGIAIGNDPADVAGTGSDDTEEEWHYKTQQEVAAESASGTAWHRETPPDAGDLAAQESDARPSDQRDAT